MSAEVYFALKPEEQALEDVKTLGDILPSNSIYLSHIDCLGHARKSPNKMGIHMTLLDGMIPNPHSIKDLDRRMKMAITSIVPRGNYRLLPMVSSFKRELILVPNVEDERVIRKARKNLIKNLDITVEDDEYLPHVTLVRFDIAADIDLIRKRINELTVLFRTLTVYTCLRGPSRHPISNTFRPGLSLRN